MHARLLIIYHSSPTQTYMAFIVDPQQTSHNKHFCKICKKGFMCGRALGGHMRAHGIGDDSAHFDEDDEEEEEEEDRTSDWEENKSQPESKRMYALRTNPNRLKSYRACGHCGKDFSSWKAFFEHGKCTAEDDADDSLLLSDKEDEAMIESGRSRYKRKRSFRGNIVNNNNFPLSEEVELANCLIMLSNATVDPILAEAEESCASASKDEDERRRINNVNVVNVDSTNFMASIKFFESKAKSSVNKTGLFECKACKKVFNSHQALGGHRASHKKVKGCFASRLDHNNNNNTSLADGHDHAITQEDRFFAKFDGKMKSKVHECSICHKVFSSGQALGGHKRCHWITSNSPTFNHADLPHNKSWNIQTDQPLDLDLNLDLNLPIRNATKIQVSTEICLQSWVGVDDNNINRTNDNENNNNINSVGSSYHINVDDETESKVKLAKLSELKDMSMNSSPWLQVGIGSSTTTDHDVGSDPYEPK